MKDMMTSKIMLADTYALVEMIKGNPNYTYPDESIVTTKLNLMELYYHCLREGGFEQAEHYFKVFSEYLVKISDSSIKYGMMFKLKHKQEKLSYADCLGYALANELGVPFLTGDEKFKHKENVEFVK